MGVNAALPSCVEVLHLDQGEMQHANFLRVTLQGSEIGSKTLDTTHTGWTLGGGFETEVQPK